MYDYLENMIEDIKNYIEYDAQCEMSEYIDADDFKTQLYDDLFAHDSITGNASGSYTFNCREAREYVLDNMDLCTEALKEFCVPAEEIADHFLNSDYEYFDVTIRCYLLGQAISEALDDDEIEKAIEMANKNL